MNIVHLAKRFFGSVRPGPLVHEDQEWLLAMLSPAEVALFRQQSVQDQLHSVACAVYVRNAVMETTGPVAIASALHDVGKTPADLGTFGRVLATLVGLGLSQSSAQKWAAASGIRARIGQYKVHDEIGASMLEEAGSDPLVIAWAREHHWDPSEWTIEHEVAHLLLAADQ